MAICTNRIESAPSPVLHAINYIPEQQSNALNYK
jgi:hypothetical protein